MRRLYNSDISDATTPDKLFSNISSMFNALEPQIECDNNNDSDTKQNNNNESMNG